LLDEFDSEDSRRLSGIGLPSVSLEGPNVARVICGVAAAGKVGDPANHHEADPMTDVTRVLALIDERGRAILLVNL